MCLPCLPVADRNDLVHHNMRSPTDPQIDIYILDSRTRFSHEEFDYTTKELLDPEFTQVGDHGTHGSSQLRKAHCFSFS